MKKNNKPVIAVNIILVVIEIIALIHDFYSFGFALFKWYTVDSNVLQLAISALVLYYLLKDMDIPPFVTVLHFITAVGLTVTFLIAPALSVASLLFLEKTAKLRWGIILYPAAVSLAYGLICLALNAAGILDGPYFFLEAGKQPAGTIVMWFAIIALICIVFAALYYRIKWRKEYV